MGRLFWKLFLWYWLAAVILVVLTAWVTHQVAKLDDADRSERSGRLRATVKVHRVVHTLSAHIEAGDIAKARGVLRSHPSPLFAVDERGQELLNRRLPRRVRALLRVPGKDTRPGRQPGERRARAGGDPDSRSRPDVDSAKGRQRGERRQVRWVVEAIRSPTNDLYVVVAALPKADRARERAHRRDAAPPALRPLLGPPRLRDYWWVRLAVALVVSGVVCYLLVRYLTGPIRRLSMATRRMSDGDFSTRIGNASKRRDEIADLATDFDRMAEQLEQLVGSQTRLLQDVAHELRSPLARLRVALELARLRADGLADAEHDRIELETERLSELIGQILELERLNQPIETDRVEAVDLSELVRDVASDASFESLLDEDRTITCEGPDDVKVTGHAGQLRSAIENVVRNACKYTPPGTRIAVRLTLAGDQAVISVADAGPGVPETSIPRLFEPFYRVDDTRTRGTGGHGLGLAIAARIVRRHQGAIEATNAKPGLTVTITLPTRPA